MLSGNMLGMLVYFFPALLLFFRTYAVVEHRVVERKLYLCFGGGVVLAAAAQAVIQGGGIDRRQEVELFVRPMIEMAFLYVGLNHRTFRQEREAGYYGAGLGLSFGATIATIQLLILESGKRHTGGLEWPGTVLVLAMGMALVLLHGGMGLWLAHRLHRGEGRRTATRLMLLYLGAMVLFTHAVDNDDWLVDGGVLFVLALMAAVLYHQGYERIERYTRGRKA